MFLSLLACAIVNWPQSYRKSHEKAPDKTEKISAEVKVLTNVQRFCDYLGLFLRKRDGLLEKRTIMVVLPSFLAFVCLIALIF